MATNTFDQISMERLIRDIEEEKAMRLLQQVMKNNKIILNLQKQLITLEREMQKRIEQTRKESRGDDNMMKGKRKKNRKEEEKDKRERGQVTNGKEQKK